MKLQVRLRESDKLLREYFKNIPSGDQAYEARRLMNMAIQSMHEPRFGDIPSNSKEDNETN